MPQNIDELYGELSKNESFPYYFKTQGDFETFLSTDKNADNFVKDFFGVENASEYLKKKDQPQIQNLAKESSSFQSPLVGQTESVVETPQMGADNNLQVLDKTDLPEGVLLPPLGYGKSLGGPVTPKQVTTKKPSEVLISKGYLLWNDNGKGSAVHKEFSKYYNTLLQLADQRDVSPQALQTALNNFTAQYNRLKPTENVKQDFDDILKVLSGKQKLMNFEVGPTGVVVKPKAQDPTPITVVQPKVGPQKPKTIEELVQMDQEGPAITTEQDKNLEIFFDFYLQGSSDPELGAQILREKEKQNEKYLLPEANRLVDFIGTNIPANFFDVPRLTEDGEPNPKRRLTGEGLYFINDAGNLKIDNIYLENEVDRYLKGAVSPLLSPALLDNLQKRYGVDKEEASDILKPYLMRLVEQKAQEQLVTTEVERKVEQMQPELRANAETLGRMYSEDINKITSDSEKLLRSFGAQIKNDAAAQINELQGAFTSDINYNYTAYKNYVDNTPGLSEEDNLALYDEFLKYVNEKTTEFENQQAAIKSNIENQFNAKKLEIESQVKKDLEALRDQYGVEEDKDGSISLAAYRELKEVYKQAYDELEKEEFREGYHVYDILKSTSASLYANAINALTAAVGYEDNPFTSVLKYAQYAESESQTPIKQFSKVLEEDGFFSGEALKSATQSIVQQAVNMGPAIATTALTGNPYIGGAIGWAQDTVNQIGENYKITFEKTGSIDDAEKAAQTSLLMQTVLYPTYALDMLPFVGGYLSKIGGKTFAGRALAGIGIEQLTETIQETTQQYQNYINTTDDLKPLTYTQWASENLKTVAIDILPATAILGGMGAAFETYNENQKEKVKKIVLARLEEIGMAQVVGDMVDVVGDKSIGIIPEILYRNNIINQQEFTQMQSVFSEVAKMYPQAKKIIQDKDLQKLYVGYLASKKKNENEIELIAAGQGDYKALSEKQRGELIASFEARNKTIDQEMQKIAKGDLVKYSKITFDDGSSVVVSDFQMERQLRLPKMQDALANGEVTITSTDGKMQQLIDRTKEDAKQYQEQRQKEGEETSGPQQVVGLETGFGNIGFTTENKTELNNLAETSQNANAQTIVNEAEKLQNVLETIVPGARIIYLRSSDYQNNIERVKGRKGSLGNTTTFRNEDGTLGIEIQIDLDRAQTNTVAHEISHAVILKTLGDNPELLAEVQSGIEGAVKSSLGEAGIASINALVDKYRAIDRPVEFLVETASLLAQEDKNLSLNLKQKIFKVIADFVSKITNGTVKLSVLKTNEYVEYMNNLANTLRSGQVSEGFKTQTTPETAPIATLGQPSSKAQFATEDDFVLPFGKYKGEWFTTTPPAYQKWLYKQDWFQPKDYLLPRAARITEPLESAANMDEGTNPFISQPIEIDVDAYNSKASLGTAIEIPSSELMGGSQINPAEVFQKFREENGRNPRVWFWMGDQSKRGEYFNPNSGVSLFAEGGFNYAFDPKNIENGEIWATGLKESTLMSRLPNADFIWIMAGSPNTSFNFAKFTSQALVEEIKAGMKENTGRTIAGVQINKGSFDEFVKIAENMLGNPEEGKWKDFLDAIRTPDILGDARMNFVKNVMHGGDKKMTLEFNQFVHNELGVPTLKDFTPLIREKYLVDNDFGNGDMGVLLKPNGQVKFNSGSHSTYAHSILGEVVGFPDTKMNIRDILPQESLVVMSRKTGMPIEKPNESMIIKTAIGDLGAIYTSVPATSLVENLQTLDLEEKPVLSFLSGKSQQARFEESSGTTQVATTVGSYGKVANMISRDGLSGDVLDYGAGLGLGANNMSDILGRPVDTLEGNIDRWQGRTPVTYTSNDQINKKYDAIVSLNVLNVVEKQIRDAIVADIFDKLNVNGKAYISARGWTGDVGAAKNAIPGLEKNSLYIQRKQKGGTIASVYQKGFDGNELVEYIQDRLGPIANVVKDNSFGKAGVVITKLAEDENQFSSKSQLPKIFTDEKGKRRSVNKLGRAEEDSLPIQAGPESLGSLGRATINEIFRIYEELASPANEVSSTLKIKDKVDGEMLKAWAKANRLWIHNFEHLMAKAEYELEEGMESQVFVSDGARYVYKSTKPTFGHNYLGLLRKTMAHNILFPDTAYEIVGFTSIAPDPTLRIIMKQPAISLEKGIDMRSDKDRFAAIKEDVLFSDQGGRPGIMTAAKEAIIQSEFEDSKYDFDDVRETIEAMGFRADFGIGGTSPFLQGTNDEMGIVIDDLHQGNIFTDTEGNVVFIDPYIDLVKTGPGSFIEEQINPIFEKFRSKSQLDFSQIAPEYQTALANANGDKVEAFKDIIKRGYTPKRIKEQLGLGTFDETSFKKAQQDIAIETMDSMGSLFTQRQEDIKNFLNTAIGPMEDLYDFLLQNDYSPIEVFTAARDLDFMSNQELEDLFGADYRQTVQTALSDNDYPADFLDELNEDARNLKVEQKAADVTDILREAGFGMIDSAIVMDAFLEYLKANNFDKIAALLVDAVKQFGRDRGVLDKTTDWVNDVKQGKLGDKLYEPDAVVHAFQTSSELFSMAGRILQMARFFKETAMENVIEKQMANYGVVLTPQQKQTLINLANDYKAAQKENKELLKTLESDWSDGAFEAYFESEKKIGETTIRLAQFIDFRKPGFWNEKITSGGSRALLGIPTTILSYVANIENNLLSTNFVAKSIQKLRDVIGGGPKATTLSIKNWQMARALSKPRYSFIQKNNAKYGVMATNKSMERYYDNLGTTNFFNDPQWVWKFLNVSVFKSQGKYLHQMTEEEQVDALNLTLTQLNDGTIEMRDGKSYTLARSMAWSLGLGPALAVGRQNPSLLLASFGPAAAELTGRAMAYGGDVKFGYMAAQRAMIDYFVNTKGTRFQDGVFDFMLANAKGDLDKGALRALSTILYADTQLYQKFEKEGLKRTLLADNMISGSISMLRGGIHKKIRTAYYENRASIGGSGIMSELKRQFSPRGLWKNTLQATDVALWTLMPFTKVPVNFLGSAIAKTLPIVSVPKYLVSEGVYQYKYSEFNKKYPIGTKIKKGQKKQYELDKIDLFFAKRQTTYDAAQMVTSFAIYGFAMSALKAGAILPKEEPEKEKAMKSSQLRGNLYNATLHYEYLKAMATGKPFKNFISQRGGYAKEGDNIVNIANFGFLGYAMGLYGSIYNSERKQDSDFMTELVDDQKNGMFMLIQSTISNGVETLPMFQGLARIGALVNDFKDPENSEQAWNNFISGSLSTSMAIFFPSFFSVMSKGNAEMIQSASDIFPNRETEGWTKMWGDVTLRVVQKLNRNISFNENTRNEFYEAAIGPFGEDLQYKVTQAEPGTAGAYFQAIFDPFAFRSYTAKTKGEGDDTALYVQAAKLNSGLINLAMMFQQVTGRDYEWLTDGKTQGLYHIISNPMRNKFRWQEDIILGGESDLGSPNFLDYQLPNDLYRKELKERGKVMFGALSKYADDIQNTIIPQVKSYAAEENWDMVEQTIADFFGGVEGQNELGYAKALKDAQAEYLSGYKTREKQYLRTMQERGLFTEDMKNKMKRMGLMTNDSRELIL